MIFKRLAASAMLALASLALPACNGFGTIPESPASVSDMTVEDERAALGVELAYEAFRTAAELAVDSGVVVGEMAERLASIDRDVYRALMVARAAYDAGNASTYADAIDEARLAIAEGMQLIKGDMP